MSQFFPSRVLAASSSTGGSRHAELLFCGMQFVVQANAVFIPARINAIGAGGFRGSAKPAKSGSTSAGVVEFYCSALETLVNEQERHTRNFSIRKQQCGMPRGILPNRRHTSTGREEASGPAVDRRTLHGPAPTERRSTAKGPNCRAAGPSSRKHGEFPARRRSLWPQARIHPYAPRPPPRAP
jgi:hypothetical protein